MGKKHKKHKSERRTDAEGEEKPHLKIVLKLGGEGVYDSDYAANSPASHAGEYTIDNERHHKKRKKKRRHNSDEHHHTLKIKTKFLKEYEESLLDEETRSEPPSSVPAPAPVSPDNASRYSPNTFSPTSVSPKSVEKPPQRRRSIAFTDQMRKSLDMLLEHLLRQLERKDPHEIFAWPVNDIIAPGYSEVIEKPMDFSTIRKKIIQHKYNNVNEFKDDFKVMVDNCCTYNRPDTVFYDVGKKLYAAGIKIMSKERLLNMKRTLSFLHDLTKTECAHIMSLEIPQEEAKDVVNLEEEDTNMTVDEQPKEMQKKEEGPANESDFDLRAHADAISFTDADNEETVAPDVLKAAKDARERLAKRCPKSKMGFLRIDDVGKTTFNFLNPDIQEREEGRVVDLGTLTGRLASGLDALPEAKEDKRNRVTPLTYLSYGPFGSFSPTYDSRVANITQEESDLLLAAYGGETEYLFAKSLHNFVQDSDYDLVRMVDDLLDTLTHGAHKQALQTVEDRRKKEEVERAKQAAQEIGEFSQQIKMEVEEGNQDVFVTNSDPIQQKLDHAGELVAKLEKSQNERLSEQPPSGQSNLKGPTEEEAAIASKLREELSDLLQHAKPEQVSSVEGVRKATGVDFSQAESSTTKDG